MNWSRTLAAVALPFGRDARYPPRLSFKEYVFDFENVGFQGIGLMPLGFEQNCLDCSAAAFSSVTRNALDVASTMYFLAKVDGVWQVREVRDGVTGKLESESIPVSLLGINHASANWLLSNALGGIRLQMPEYYIEDARRLLSELVELDEDNDGCPQCGAADSSPMNNSRKIAFLAVHLFNIPLPWQSKQRHCDSCGKVWSADQEFADRLSCTGTAADTA